MDRREFLKLGAVWAVGGLSLLVAGCGGGEEGEDNGEENGGEEEDD